jgi:hypothetical protein
MAISQQTGSTNSDVGPKNFDLTPATYTTLGSLLDPTKPDVRELYVETFGDQGITGFLDLIGAKKTAGTADEVHYYEEGRLHRTVQMTYGAANAGATSAFEITHIDEVAIGGAAADQAVRPNDVLLDELGNRFVVIAPASGAATGTMRALDDGAVSAQGTAVQANVIGNIYAQGTDQPGLFYETDIVKRKNPFVITKETFHVNGSQATNIGYLKVDGQYRWFMKGEMDARKRFMNQREAMLMYSQLAADNNLALASGSVAGSEGYFAAIEDRGIVATGAADAGIAAMADIDDIILLLDKQGAPSEYAMYLDRKTSLNIDDVLASGVATQVTAGLAGQFGAFNNDADLAVKLGFKSFTRGGYTFHKHDWKMLNDPTVGGIHSTTIGAGAVSGALIPMTNVADARTGVASPSLEMNFKAANGYSRDIEHWVEGGGVLGYATNGEDLAKFHYRSETNLVTRAANQHVLLKRG